MSDSVRGGIGTSFPVSVVGSTTDTIDFASDRDWYQVSPVAGRRYRFDLRGAASAGGAQSAQRAATLDGPNGLLLNDLIANQNLILAWARRENMKPAAPALAGPARRRTH